MLKIGICDADDKFAKELIEILKGEIVKKKMESSFKSFKNSKSLMKALNGGGKFDIIFLDTHIGDECGVKLGKEIKSVDKNIELIYFSTTTKYVLDCYDMGAFNYILKPLENNVRLITQFDRLLIKKNVTKGDFITIRGNGRVAKLRIKDIRYIETVHKMVRIHYRETFIDVREKMGDLEEHLEGYYFLRCHKSYLVNAKDIVKINKKDLKLSKGEIVPLSRLRVKYVKEKIQEFMENKDLI